MANSIARRRGLCGCAHLAPEVLEGRVMLAATFTGAVTYQVKSNDVGTIAPLRGASVSVLAIDINGAPHISSSGYTSNSGSYTVVLSDIGNVQFVAAELLISMTSAKDPLALLSNSAVSVNEVTVHAPG